MTCLPNIRDLNLAELEQQAESMGIAKFRAAQLAGWIHQKGVASFDEMTNLPREIRAKIAANFSVGGMVVLDRKISHDGEAEKYLLQLADGQAVESVLMQYRHGVSVCLSTQVGCRMGCKICASGLEGLVRNLTPGEMLDQIHAMQREAGKRVGSIVLMGSGEPLDNYSATIKFLELVKAPYGLNIGHRHITLSTSGIVPRIYDLMKLQLSITLAVSLHAPNNALRNQLVPINQAYPLERLLPACRSYATTTGRRVSFEYALLGNINDSKELAQELGQVIAGIHCHINLIPANPVPERGLVRSSMEKVKTFKKTLEALGYPVTVRRELGLDIDAACGQLRRRVLMRGGTDGVFVGTGRQPGKNY